MKKITLVLALMLLFISNSEAQRKGSVSQNKLGFGLELNLGVTGIYKNFGDYSSSLDICPGFFVNYLMSNNFSLELAPSYSFRIYDDEANYKFNFFHYINAPVLAKYHFENKNYLGLGVQYSQCLNAPNIPGTNFNYLSALLEYSYMSRFSGGKYITYVAEDKIFRHTFRVGYGITPITGISQEGELVKSNLFFFETVIKWDLFNQGKGRSMSRGKSTSKKRR